MHSLQVIEKQISVSGIALYQAITGKECKFTSHEKPPAIELYIELNEYYNCILEWITSCLAVLDYLHFNSYSDEDLSFIEGIHAIHQWTQHGSSSITAPCFVLFVVEPSLHHIDTVTAYIRNYDLPMSMNIYRLRTDIVYDESIAYKWGFLSLGGRGSERSILMHADALHAIAHRSCTYNVIQTLHIEIMGYNICKKSKSAQFIDEVNKMGCELPNSYINYFKCGSNLYDCYIPMLLKYLKTFERFKESGYKINTNRCEAAIYYILEELRIIRRGSVIPKDFVYGDYQDQLLVDSIVADLNP